MTTKPSISKSKAFELVAGLRSDLAGIVARNTRDMALYNHWREATETTLRNIFGVDTPVHDAFRTVHFNPPFYLNPEALEDYEITELVQNNVLLAQQVLGKAEIEIKFWSDDAPADPIDRITDSVALALNICDQFHLAARALRERGRDRAPLLVEDEYDVQYMMGALLTIDFADVVPEDYVPSYAGGTSRIDFVLRPERIAIETKMTRKSLRDKQVGDELTVDIKRYETRHDVDTLICLVHDPEHLIKNPRGLEADLEKHPGRLKVHVLIRPK